MGLGVLLFMIGLLFKIQHWPDMFKGIFSGPIIAIIGVVIFFISLIKRQVKKENAL